MKSAYRRAVGFTAGTQVVVALEVREPDGRVRQVSAAELASDGGRVPAALLSRVVGYVTAAIETLQKDAWIVSRDDQEPFGSLVFRRVEEVFRNTAYRLLHLTLRSSGGVEQTLLTTAEHPAYVLGQGWVAAGKLKAGDTISEPGGGFSSVVACRSQEYPEGIEVYNLRVQESHTYFVRAEGSTAEPVWVHNDYSHKMTGSIERNGEVLETASYESGGMQGSGWRASLATHTEVKFLTDAETLVQSGDSLLMAGKLDPCKPGCRPAIRSFVESKQTSVTYNASSTGRTWSWMPYKGPNKGTVLQQMSEGGKVVPLR